MNRNMTTIRRKYLIAMLGLLIVAGSRFYDHVMAKHIAPWGILEKISSQQVIMAVWLVLLVEFMAVVLRRMDPAHQKQGYYLTAALGAFAVPLYLCETYFGAMDVSAWALTCLALIILLWGHLMWLVIPIVLLAALIAPMSVLSSGALLLAVLVYEGASGRQTGRWVLMAAAAVCEGVGILYAYQMGYLAWDAQSRISARQAAVSVFILLPCFLAAADLFMKMVRRSTGVMKPATVLAAAGWIPGAVLWALQRDFCRAIVLPAVYTLFYMLFRLADGDEDTRASADEVQGRIPGQTHGWVMLLLGAFLVICLWFAGGEAVKEEFMLKL